MGGGGEQVWCPIGCYDKVETRLTERESDVRLVPPERFSAPESFAAALKE